MSVRIPPRDLARRIRTHSLKMTGASNSSHIGSCLSIADILGVLYGQILKLDATDPDAPWRDRMILSKGHAAAAVYAALAELSFFPMEWLDSFQADGTTLAGHATHHVPGVEVSTGALGHGMAIACGMSMAAKADGSTPRSFALLSDGECNEGAVWESALFASHHGLDNLTVIVDHNRLQGLGTTDEVMSLGRLEEKWRSFDWAVRVVDGHDIDALTEALTTVPWTDGRPSALVANTVKGKGVGFMENSLAWHYRSVNEEQLAQALAEIEAGP